MPRAVFALLFLLCAPGLARAAEPPEYRVTGDLAIGARHIFQKYCSECHTGSLDPGTSKLKIMDHAQVVAKKPPVPFADPNGRAQIIELIKDGSMPPGNLAGPTAKEIAVLEAWVSAKAPMYPVAFNEQYTLGAIADHFEKWNADPKGEFPRYVSFAHLVRDGQPLPDLGAAEEQLRSALSVAAGIPMKPAPVVKLFPVDPSATVFSINARDLGWTTTTALFDKMEGLKPTGGAARLQPFDLLLLEYPLGRVLAATDPLLERLAKLTGPTSQVRPVPFVQGDWLTRALVSGKQLTPLAADIKALAELNTSLARGDAEPDGPGAKPFAGAKTISVPAPIEGRAPMPPLSAWYTGDVVPAKAPFDLKAELVVAEKAATEVSVDEFFKLRVVSDRKVNFTLLLVQADGEVHVQPVQGGTVLKEKTERLLAPTETGFRIASITGGGNSTTEYFVLFASEEELPLPTTLRSKHADKYVWRFLLNPTAKEPFDPNAVVRKVIPIKVTRK